MSIVLHPTTESKLNDFLKSPSHALLIEGPEGSGKSYLGYFIAKNLLTLGTLEEAKVSPRVFAINPKGSISIDEIREVYGFLKLKVPGYEDIKRIVMIIDAPNMTIEAQNALLKQLEEPPPDTIFILTSSDSQKLLPTVISRLQKLSVNPLEEGGLLAIARASEADKTSLATAIKISDGRAGLFHSLINSDEEHLLSKNIELSKKIIAMKPFDRLVEVESLLKHKEEIQNLLEALRLVSFGALKKAASENNKSSALRWHKIVKRLADAQSALAKNAQPKLVLTDLMLNL